MGGNGSHSSGSGRDGIFPQFFRGIGTGWDKFLWEWDGRGLRIHSCVTLYSRVRPIWSHVRPNFSRVRLSRIPGRTGASSHSRKEKKYPRLRNSVVQQKTPPLGLYRGLNQSEIVKGGPPLWLAAVQIFLYVCVRVDKCVTCAAAVRQRERGE